MDLRERVVAACEQGQSQVEVAQRFGVCTKTVQRYVARAKAGQLAPRPLPGRSPRLAPDQEPVLPRIRKRRLLSWCRKTPTAPSRR